MTEIDSIRGRIALCIVQCSAMIELAAMPLWVGVLIQYSGLDPQQAGTLVMLYVAGAVVSCLTIAPIFHRLTTGLFIAAAGTLVGGAAFFLISQTSTLTILAILHLIAGLSIGPVLAVTEGTIGRSERPHKLFALSHIAVSLLAAVVLATGPIAIDKFGGSIFFLAIAVIMMAGLLASILGFPSVAQKPTLENVSANKNQSKRESIPRYVWAVVIGLFFMAVNFAMTMSFVERVGASRGYELALITAVLTAMAIVKLFPAALAVVLESRLSTRAVLYGGPIVQAICALAIFAGPHVVFYIVAAPIFIGTLLFTNIFAFGLISKLDVSGRANAAYPSFVLAGTGVGAFVGGFLVKNFGFASIGMGVTLFAAIAICCFSTALLRARAPLTSTGPFSVGETK